MKKIMLTIAFAALLGAPLFGQRGEGGEGRPAAAGEPSLAELHRLMRIARMEMEALERELARTSLEPPKADVISERVRQITEAMKEGRIDDLPEGLREYIRDNPDDVARTVGRSADEIRRLTEDADQLTEILRRNPEILKRLAESQGAMDEVLRRQHAAERRLEEALRRQRESAEQTEFKIDEAIELAHQLREQSQSQGQGDPQNNQQQTSDSPPEGQEQTQQPNQGAQDQYEPGNSEGARNDQTEDFKRDTDPDNFQTGLREKDMGHGSSRAERPEPGKYRGFADRFAREAQRRAEERRANRD